LSHVILQRFARGAVGGRATPPAPAVKSLFASFSSEKEVLACLGLTKFSLGETPNWRLAFMNSIKTSFGKQISTEVKSGTTTRQ
jgi:hypothetical protein